MFNHNDTHDYHRTLLDALESVTGPLEMSAWASEEFAQNCKATGKPVCDLTVSDLRRAWHQVQARIQLVYAPAGAHKEITQ